MAIVFYYWLWPSSSISLAITVRKTINLRAQAVSGEGLPFKKAATSLSDTTVLNVISLQHHIQGVQASWESNKGPNSSEPSSQ